MFDPMSELEDGSPLDDPTPMGDDAGSGDDTGAGDSGAAPAGAAPARGGFGGGNRKFSDDIHSISIYGQHRTFYIDLKESGNGKFFKVSEKSRGGRKSTIMFDQEQLDEFIQAFQEMKEYL